MKIPYRRSPQDFICGWEFRENRHSESHTYGHKRISIRTFEIYFSIYVKLGTRDLKIILLNIYEFLNNLRRKAIDLLLLLT
jgi:hypothetical protein